MNTSTVVDEFECHQKCHRNNSCKSFNIHPGADIAKRLCELNNKTWKMTPESFKKMNGSSYYGPVKVSSNDWTSTRAFHLTNKEALRCFDAVFLRPYRYFSIPLKEGFSLSDRFKIFTSNWLWIEICRNVVLRKIDITMTKINKKLQLIRAEFCAILYN